MSHTANRKLRAFARYSPHCLASSVLVCLLAATSTAAPPERITFEQHVQPILKTHCFYCHGEDGKREGGLDLRLRRWLVKGGESGPAIAPGKAAESHLLERVISGEMPPAEDKRLGEADIAIIRGWIESGAATLEAEPESLDGHHFTVAERGWWSLQPLRRPDVPCVSGGAASNAIDAFLLAKLPSPQLAPPAAPEILIRRLYLDLLGLPPTPAEVQAFIADARPGAWERLVDRALASPAYGERWGRHWLDVAGYADSEGYTEADAVREHAYWYRDYVLRALNADMPYDRFVEEQLAGDELAGWPQSELTPETRDLLVATGFLRTAPDGTGESGVDQMVARNQTIADTLQVVGASLMGMTMHCAQCHDHRYDPIPQADYYRMRAIFEPALDWKQWKTPTARRVSLYTSAERETREAIEARVKLVDAKRQQRIDFYIERTLEHELLALDEAERGPLRDAFKAAAKDRTPAQAKLLEDQPNIGRITAGSLYLYDRRRDSRAKRLDEIREQLAGAAADRARQAALEPLDPALRDSLTAALNIGEEQRSDEQKSLLSEHPLATATAANIEQLDAAVAEQLKPYRTAAEEIRSYQIRKELDDLANEAKAIREEIPRERYIRPLTENPGAPPATYLFHRGDPQQPKETLEPSGLAVLELQYAPVAGGKTTGRRLGFARYLMQPENPLPSRVLANRLWLHHFGRGLVRTPGDFGRLGELPTHPELLDYLASRLIEHGWSVKKLHRELLTSSAYRQSSNADPALVEADPENLLWGRWTPRRLEAELVRDSMLAVAGELNREMFGEPVPVMEDEVGQIVIGKENLDGERKPTKAVELNGQEARRSVYVQVRRSRPLSVIESFDLAETTPHCTQRASSNVAPQALMLMNSDFVIRMAEQFGQRLKQQRPDGLAAQVRLGWQLAYAVEPNETQLSGAMAFLEKQRGSAGDDPDLPLTSFCQALLSSSRFLYVD
ncbi:MAG: PSD1 domain-containing protein [Planctomycetales bacterium]|nr:PSD1 domain-containing protein [Planctomycetales bacterium]